MSKMEKIYSEILQKTENKQGQVFIVIDPPNQSAEIAGKIAKEADNSGVDAIAIGGSIGATGEHLHNTIAHIKENSSLPTILFPGNIATVSEKADAIYFMSMLNSTDPYFITGAQTASAFEIKKSSLETIPTSYIVIEPGRAVGWVGRAKLIPRELPYLAAATALAGQYMGSKLAILESGGGAPQPAPLEMIKLTRKSIDIPLLVAGGVRNKKWAHDVIKAGADIIHVGTAIENIEKSEMEIRKKLTEFVSEVKKASISKK